MKSTWTILAITLAIQAMISAAALAGPVLAPEIAEAIGLRAVLVGVQVGLIYAAAAISSLASGDIIRRQGAMRTSQIALTLAALGLLLSLVGTIPMIAMGALLIGLGYGVVTPASSHLLAQSTPRNRMGIVFSLKQTGVPLGGILAGLVLPPVTGALGWRVAIGLCVLACLAVAICAQGFQAILDQDRQSQTRGNGMLRTFRGLLDNKVLRELALISFIFAAMQLILSGFLVTFLTEARGFSLATAGAVLALAQAAGVGGRLLWGWCADHVLSARQVLTLLAFVSAICAGIFCYGSDTGTLVLLGGASAVFGAAAIGWNGVFLAEVARVVPRETVATATGAVLFMTYAGVVVGPPLFAVLVAHIGFGSAFGVAGAIMAILALFLAFGSRPGTIAGSRSST
ncbi:MAG: MFS transporter [Pseudorhodobacter sp.]